ncbi:MAG: hypothetical protein NWR72_02420 [Bacteroidia bacterium]|nr:hypothetical protein [Bacteroidia bacterium]
MLLLIGGVSRSGKTKLSQKIALWLRTEGHKVSVLHQDEYVKPESEIPMIRDHIDWEVPESIDWARWQEAIRSAALSHDWVIAEGLFAFSDQELNQAADRQIMVNVSEDTFLQRKREDLRWGQEPEWFIAHIWRSFLIYGEPASFAGLVLSGEQPQSPHLWQAYLISGKIGEVNQ